MFFTRHSAGKIWLSICIQDSLSDQSGTINLTRFLYQICLTGKSDEKDYFYVQNTEAHEDSSQTSLMELFVDIYIS